MVKWTLLLTALNLLHITEVAMNGTIFIRIKLSDTLIVHVTSLSPPFSPSPFSTLPSPLSTVPLSPPPLPSANSPLLSSLPFVEWQWSCGLKSPRFESISPLPSPISPLTSPLHIAFLQLGLYLHVEEWRGGVNPG